MNPDGVIQPQVSDKDIYRDPAVRFLGYSHEFARAFGHLIHLPSGILNFCYGLSATYICTDVVNKSFQESRKENAKGKDIALVAEKTFLWHTFASVVFPRFFIDKISDIAIKIARSDLKVPTRDGRVLATILGIALIPILVNPIDNLVDKMGLGANDSPKKSKMKEEKEYDIYRDSLLRYLGYSNEVGEAFRPLVPRYMVKLSYCVAMGYVLSDTMDKSTKVYASPSSTMKDVGKKAGDVLIWQTFASVAIPGFTINRITKVTRLLLKRVPNTTYIPTAVGLVSIPFIIRPIDHLVDYLMENTYRKYFNT